MFPDGGQIGAPLPPPHVNFDCRMEPDTKRAFYLGRYNCIERLGTGPLGETFRAKIYGVAGFEKQFAVKRLHARLCVDELFVARFVTAATAYSGLDHERIAR